MSLSRVMFGLPLYLWHSDGNDAARLRGERHRRIRNLWSVDERDEPRQLVRIVEPALPFAGVALDVTGHRVLEFRGQPERVGADDIAQMVEAAIHRLQPWRG